MTIIICTLSLCLLTVKRTILRVSNTDDLCLYLYSSILAWRYQYFANRRSAQFSSVVKAPIQFGQIQVGLLYSLNIPGQYELIHPIVCRRKKSREREGHRGWKVAESRPTQEVWCWNRKRVSTILSFFSWTSILCTPQSSRYIHILVVSRIGSKITRGIQHIFGERNKHFNISHVSSVYLESRKHDGHGSPLHKL